MPFSLIASDAGREDVVPGLFPTADYGQYMIESELAFREILVTVLAPVIVTGVKIGPGKSDDWACSFEIDPAVEADHRRNIVVPRNGGDDEAILLQDLDLLLKDERKGTLPGDDAKWLKARVEKQSVWQMSFHSNQTDSRDQTGDRVSQHELVVVHGGELRRWYQLSRSRQTDKVGNSQNGGFTHWKPHEARRLAAHGLHHRNEPRDLNLVTLFETVFGSQIDIKVARKWLFGPAHRESMGDLNDGSARRRFRGGGK